MEGLSRPLPFGGQQAPQRQPGRQSTRIKVPTHKGEQLSKFKGYTFTGSGVPSESHESEAPQGKNINSREAVKRQVCAKTIPQKESHKSGVEQLIAAAGKVDPEIEIEMEMASAASLNYQWQMLLELYQGARQAYSKDPRCSKELEHLLTELKAFVPDVQQYQIAYLSKRYGLTTKQASKKVQAVSLDTEACRRALKESNAVLFEWRSFGSKKSPIICYSIDYGACLALAGQKLVWAHIFLMRHERVVEMLRKAGCESALLARMDASTAWLRNAINQYKEIICKSGAQSLDIKPEEVEPLLYETVFTESTERRKEYESLLQSRWGEWVFRFPLSVESSSGSDSEPESISESTPESKSESELEQFPALPHPYSTSREDTIVNMSTVCGPWFKKNMFPKTAEKRAMARHLKVNLGQVSNWFANKRRRLRIGIAKQEAAMNLNSDSESSTKKISRKRISVRDNQYSDEALSSEESKRRKVESPPTD